MVTRTRRARPLLGACHRTTSPPHLLLLLPCRPLCTSTGSGRRSRVCLLGAGGGGKREESRTRAKVGSGGSWFLAGKERWLATGEVTARDEPVLVYQKQDEIDRVLFFFCPKYFYEIHLFF